MLFDYISDLHIPFYANGKKEINQFIDGLIEREPTEILILAGDISEKNEDIIWTLEAFSKYYEKIFFVFGNHDLYMTTRKEVEKYEGDSNLKIQAVKDYFNGHDVVTILDNEMVYYEGLSIAGSRNWYSLKRPEDEAFWRNNMADSKYIYPKTMEASEEMHRVDMEFLTSLPKDLDILITHVPPVYISKSGYEPNGCFYNYDRNLPEPKVWFAGHQHSQIVTFIGDTWLCMSPYGYPGEVTNPGISLLSMSL